MEKRIVFAAIEAMREQGIRFTVDDVAKRLGISKKTIYQYYASKDDIFARIIDLKIADIVEQQDEIIGRGMDFASTLKALITIESRIGRKMTAGLEREVEKMYPAQCERIDAFQRERIGWLCEMLEEGVAAGRVRAIDCKIAARMLYGGVIEFCQNDFLEENNLTFTDALQAVTDVFLYGVLQQPRQEHEMVKKQTAEAEKMT